MHSILEGNNPWTQPSFSLSNRIARAIWGIVYALLFRPSPQVCYGWRAFLLRCFGAKLGKQCCVCPRARIWAPWNLKMEDNSRIGNDVNCYSIAQISLGKRALVSEGSSLCTGTHDYETHNLQLYAKPIHIGEMAWICAEVFICPGVTVGNGAVIGARSVVTKNMPEWTICAGNPCSIIKQRIIHS
jgi:putative colanic acid biosynthesis acetyltransferase WcaF